MKKIIGVSLVSLLFLALNVNASFDSTSERIENYDTVITLNTDNSIDVKETIVYNFRGNERHGIFRDIPVKYQSKLGSFSTPLSDITVTDEKGTGYMFEVSHSGSYQHIKIGDPNKTLTGAHTYVISYTVQRAIGYFDSFDEIYRNAPGQEWEVPIMQSETTVVLPKTLRIADLQIACYVGVAGSTQKCISDAPLSPEATVNEISFNPQRVLDIGEGMTVAVGFPKGIVRQPSKTETVLGLIKDNGILLLPILVLIFLIYHWSHKGRDPKGRGVIIAQYDAPKDFSPLEAGTIIKGRVDTSFISGEIVNLAVLGYLSITRTEEKKFLRNNIDYTLDKIKEADNAIPEATQNIMQGIFEDGANSVKLSDLKNKFYKEIPGIKSKVWKSLVAKGYYDQSPEKVTAKYFMFGIFVIFLGTFAGQFVGNSLVLPMFIISGAMIIIFSFIMPKVTLQGAEMRDYILGLKEYLQIAEKNRLDFHNAPEKNPKLFEKLLPYAIVLGVEKAWAKEFQDMHMSPPDWYHGTGGAFNAMVFSSDMRGFSSMTANTMASAPSSHSGSGGGGFSGGGGGGGGGGSW